MAKNVYKGADHFTKAAKQQGYPARSVFKLEEIDQRVRLLRQGQRVLDLGAAPGSWSLYAATRIGPKGHLLSIDLSPIEIPVIPPMTYVQGDALSLDNEVLATFAPYDIVLSDMAPRTTGNRLGDQTRSFELFMRALDVAKELLAPGGSFVGKIFMGGDYPKAQKAVKDAFVEVRAMRPDGTRTTSYEQFLIGLKKR